MHGDRADQGHRNAADEIYFNDDHSECIVLERYRDSEALVEHLAHIRDLMEAIVATGSVTGEVLGEPSQSSERRWSKVSLRDADVLVLFTNGADPDEIPGYESLPAVRNGAVSVLEYTEVVGLNTPTPLSIPYSLEFIRPALEAAAR